MNYPHEGADDTRAHPFHDTKADSRPSGIAGSLKRCGAITDELGDALNRLHTRLSPVLRAGVPTPDLNTINAPNRVSPDQCPVADDIYTLAEGLAGRLNTVRDLLERVDL